MKRLSLRILLIVALLLGSGTANAVWAAAGDVQSANVTVEQWVGQSFTFLALPNEEQADGYGVFTVDQATQGFQGDRSVRLSYAPHVGKQVEVTAVVPFAAGDNQKDYLIHMTVSETGEKLLGRTVRGQLEGLVLTADLTNARQQFLGTTVYPKIRELSGLYVPGWDTLPASVTNIIGSPATVVDVYAGNRSQKPIWLIVSVNGTKAILPIAYSWTNIPVVSWTLTAPWQEVLFTQDPRVSLGGSSDLWHQIEIGNVQEGMTKEQVELTWGKAVRSESDGSIWIYGTTKLNFSGNVLHSIETIPDEIPS